MSLTMLPLSFEIRLEERKNDRVIVSVLLTPGPAPSAIEAVAVELFSRKRESLSPRMLLPIAGQVTAPMAVKVELRSREDLPAGAMVMGTLWWDSEPLTTCCPADPWTELEAHLRGRRCVAAAREPADLATMTPAERGRLVAAFPWIAARRCAPEEPEPLDAYDIVDDVTEEYGLDQEHAEWLRELLNEDDG